MKDERGYRSFEGNGATVRADVVEIYVFARETQRDARFLQVLRAKEPMRDSWHPVMGHCEAGESTLKCAVRELREEIDLDVMSPTCLGMWAMEQTYPFYIHQIDTVVISPRFALEVSPGFEPTLNHEHTDHRWCPRLNIERDFLWPGQRMTARDVLKRDRRRAD